MFTVKQSTTRRVWALLVCCWLLLAVCAAPFGAVRAQAAGAHAHNNVTFTRWNSTSALPGAAGSYYLDADVILKNTWTVPAGGVALDLNGHVIRMAANGRVIDIPANASLALYDCNTQELYHFESSGERGYWVPSSLGSYTVKGGVIIGTAGFHCSEAGNGGAGVRNLGTFTMYGGNIVGCYIYYEDYSVAGGGVYNAGTFAMYGGSISGNAAYSTGSSRAAAVCGGGVYNEGTFVMEGGEIRNNTVSSADISSSALSSCGAGIDNEGTLYVRGNAEISYNMAGRYNASCRSGNGGGINNGQVNPDSITHITGGNIHHNISTGQGGGISVTRGAVCMSDGKVVSNAAVSAGNGGGVGISSAANFVMTGGSIVENIESGNSLEFGGAGIWSSGYLILDAGSKAINITGNKGSKGQYGGIRQMVDPAGKSYIAMTGGKLNITGNTAKDDIASNVVLDSGCHIKVTGPLSGSKVGVTADKGRITSGYADQNKGVAVDSIFSADLAGSVALTSDKKNAQLTAVQKPAAGPIFSGPNPDAATGIGSLSSGFGVVGAGIESIFAGLFK